MLKFEDLPNWLINLELEDLSFIKRFMLFSGSLKDIAKDYDVTYPTLRLRLDKLIEKISLFDCEKTDPFIERIKGMALDDKMDIDTAKVIISEYKKLRG